MLILYISGGTYSLKSTPNDRFFEKLFIAILFTLRDLARNLPFFSTNELGETVAVNSDRYRAMLNKFLFTKIEEKDIGNILVQQDGAMCHTAEATLDVLRLVFEDRVISRRAILEMRFDTVGLLFVACRQS